MEMEIEVLCCTDPARQDGAQSLPVILPEWALGLSRLGAILN